MSVTTKKDDDIDFTTGSRRTKNGFMKVEEDAAV